MTDAQAKALADQHISIIETIVRMRFKSQWREYLTDGYLEAIRMLRHYDPTKGSPFGFLNCKWFAAAIRYRVFGRPAELWQRHQADYQQFKAATALDGEYINVDIYDEYEHIAGRLNRWYDGRLFLEHAQGYTKDALAKREGCSPSRMGQRLRHVQERVQSY